MIAKLRAAALLALLTLLALLSTALPSLARVRVHGGVGLGFGTWPYFYGPPRHFRRPRPYFVPPVVYAIPPPPIYFTPLPPPMTVTPSQCRVFSGDATNNQTGQPFFGRACLWPDGQWHIVQ